MTAMPWRRVCVTEARAVPEGTSPAMLTEIGIAEVWHREEQAQLREALKQLTHRQRMVLELSYFQGYTHIEIANMCQLPSGPSNRACAWGYWQ